MLFLQKVINFIYLTVIVVNSFPAEKKEKITNRNLFEDIPPTPKHAGIFKNKNDRMQVTDRLSNWKLKDENYIWELSGLYQGDIMGMNTSEKNGLLNETFRWPDAIVPYYIDEDNFNEESIEQINNVFQTYHNKTCIRFRPYQQSDKNFITVKSDDSGCWSYVGKRGEGQIVNFQSPVCLRYGTIIHEFMHVLGFYHQQSAADRDDWVKIVWSNITPGREHNFDKYDNKTVTDYGITYDYSSVMHYSSKAFSKNGKHTIVPKLENVTLGQRTGFSDKDIEKINIMYKTECEARNRNEESIESIEY